VIRFAVVMLAAVPLAIASADTPAPPKHAPPKAAFDACAKAKQGDACSFTGRAGRTLSGTCEVPRSGGSALVCRPARMHGGSGSGSGSGH